MDLVDLYQPRPYPRVNMQAFNSQPQPAPHAPQLALWTNQQLMALYQQQRNAVMMAQSGLHGARQTEPKPRLTKDEVDFLEGEFAKNPKPTSSTKRELAEQMRVEVPRINNWFQNRRAKEKQLKKHREIEDKGRSSSSGDADDLEDEDGEGYENPSIGPSTAPFGDEDVEDAEEDSDDQDISAENESLDFAAASMPSDMLHGSPDGSESDGFVHVEYPSTHSPAAHLPDMMHDDFHSAQAGAFSFLPTEAALPESMRTSPLEVLTSQPEMLGNQGLYSAFPATDYFAVPQMSSYASGPHHGMEGASPMHASSPDSQTKLEHLSPGSLVESPQPGPDMRFKSPPPPADIASRRNMRRPAPLVGLGSLRAGAHGPKTGIELPRRADAASPMRRISSASSFGPARIQKSFSNPGPRSPFAFDRTKDALYQSLHTTQSPVLNTLNSAFSPLTPDTQGLRENTVSSNASDDEQGYAFGALGAPFYKHEQTIKTPPSTPGLRLNFHEHPFANPSDPWSYTTQDEPLPTPSLCSHGSEVDFSLAPQLPSYVASQPVTPSFPPSMGPTYNGFFGQSLPNAEYHFPDSFAPDSSVRMSPGQPTKAKQTQFQFAQNVTPQDFNADK